MRDVSTSLGMTEKPSQVHAPSNDAGVPGLSSARAVLMFFVRPFENQRFLGPSRTGKSLGMTRMCRVRRVSQWLIVCLLALNGCGQAPAPAPVVDFVGQRERMVREQLVRRGVVDERVLAAMRKVPREEFVPPEVREASYKDGPLPIGYDQTISQPYIVGFMTEQLRLRATDRVLEVGTGSGYQAAILAELVGQVYTVEIIEPLANNAEATLKRLGYKNVHVKVGDGYKGWPEQAPFDAVIVTCAPDHVPAPLITQLKEGGRMVIPVGERFAQELYLLEKEQGQLKKQAVLPVVFVPMKGEPDRH
jgi:protein-L-isoaspartate(D-aspartate) O-methyltransferase